MFKTFNERQALSVFLQSRRENLVTAIAKWIEVHWNNGSVDEASLVYALENVFGDVRCLVTCYDENNMIEDTYCEKDDVTKTWWWKIKHERQENKR